MKMNKLAINFHQSTACTKPKTVASKVAGSPDHVSIQLIAHVAITLWLDLEHQFDNNFTTK